MNLPFIHTLTTHVTQGNILLKKTICLWTGIGLILIWLLYPNQLLSQPYGNEWIDFSKTYYKFKVGIFSPPSTLFRYNPHNANNGGYYNGLRRITYETLQELNLHTQLAQHFQLWRNGKEVPIFITKTTGTLGIGDYIEFWGESNDGEPDKALYRFEDNQKNDRWSLFENDASYFLTFNPAGGNKRFTQVVNDPSTSGITPKTHFEHTINIDYWGARAMGFAVSISGQHLQSSSFENGEGWGPSNYVYTLPVEFPLKGLSPYRGPGAPKLRLTSIVGGERNFIRQMHVFVGPSSKANRGNSLRDFQVIRYTPTTSVINNIPLDSVSVADRGSTNIKYAATSNGLDVVTFLKTSLTYERTFDFTSVVGLTNTNSFRFDLPKTNQPQLFDIIANVDATELANGFLPYIYDLTNGKKYTGQLKAANTFSFLLEPLPENSKLVFIKGNIEAVGTTPNNYKKIASTEFSTKTFINYSLPANQANYLIISNKLLYPAGNPNEVEAYRAYRASAPGGLYNAKVYDIEELTDQFAFGIRKHPLAIRNFVHYTIAKNAAPNKPKYVFLIGRGVTYTSYESDLSNTSQYEALNLVPTWGQPASDNMLVANQNNQTATPVIPIGRLAAVNGAEIRNYLDKVIEFEQLQQSGTDNIWQKSALHLIGGSDAQIVNLLKGYMDSYKAILEDTLAGATVKSYVRVNDPNTAKNNAEIQNQVSAGTGLVTYFGHSSSTSLDFNLNDPFELTNTAGKYPVFLLNGCNASEFYNYSPGRLVGNNKTLSENFILARERGAIAVMSSSHYGVPQYLNLLTRNFYRAAANTMYGKGVGDILKEAIHRSYLSSTISDYYNRLTCEEFILNADPAIVLYTINKPDFEIDSTSMVFSPSLVTTATDSLNISTTIYNRGMAVGDSVMFELHRTLPNNSKVLLFKQKIARLKNQNTVSVTIPIIGVLEKGLNHFRATIDSTNQIPEKKENNNGWGKSLLITDNEITPVIPYPYAVVNQLPIKFVGTTVNPQAGSINYRLQLDTTEAFNSSQLRSFDQSGSTNIVEFNPSLTLLDSMVYYWRISPVTAGVAINWKGSSFMYYSNGSEGFNQSHYYQHQKSEFSKISLNGSSRRFEFDSLKNNLYISAGVYGYSFFEDSHNSINLNGASIISGGPCVGSAIMINVFDSVSIKPWDYTKGIPFGAAGGCSWGRNYNFDFQYFPASNRKKAMDFLDAIPKGMYVTVRINLDPDPGQLQFWQGGKADSSYPSYWMRDTLIYGSGNSLFHRLFRQGFYGLQNLVYAPKKASFIFVFKKGDSSSFKPRHIISNGIYDRQFMSVDLPMVDTGGIIKSPLFGPSAEWQFLEWRGNTGTSALPDDGSTDQVQLDIIGVAPNGQESKLRTLNKDMQDVDISDINANQYPYLRLLLHNNDPIKASPYQLNYWRLQYLPLPEGAIAPGEYFDFTRDASTQLFKNILEAGIDTLKFGVAFKNISPSKFKDSISVQVLLTQPDSGSTLNLPMKRLKPLIAGDTVRFYFEGNIDTLDGNYNLLVNFNPNKIQQEQSIQNNFMYRPFFVNGAPEGMADSLSYFEFTRNPITHNFKDTLLGGVDTLKFGLAFKNISTRSFADSLEVFIEVKPDGFPAETVPYRKLKPIVAGDTARIFFDSLTYLMSGWYTLNVLFNPDKKVRERSLDNNYFSYRFYVANFILPVNIISFTASLQNGNALLQWQSDNEESFSHYEIEHCTDGVQFEKVGIQKAKNQPGRNQYQFVHVPSTRGYQHYRLKMVDNNGRFVYSVIRQVFFEESSMLLAGPNPFTNRIRIQPSQLNEPVQLTMLNAAGQVLKTIKFQGNYEINTTNLPAGTYFLRITQSGKKTQIKMEKLESY